MPAKARSSILRLSGQASLVSGPSQAAWDAVDSSSVSGSSGEVQYVSDLCRGPVPDPGQPPQHPYPLSVYAHSIGVEITHPFFTTGVERLGIGRDGDGEVG